MQTHILTGEHSIQSIPVLLIPFMTLQERFVNFGHTNVNIRGILGECTGIESWLCMGVTRQTATSCSNVGDRHKRGG